MYQYYTVSAWCSILLLIGRWHIQVAKGLQLIVVDLVVVDLVAVDLIWLKQECLRNWRLYRRILGGKDQLIGWAVLLSANQAHSHEHVLRSLLSMRPPGSWGGALT
jgi:hypothetical protein